jgi:putative molybdopterin biosynthesis protein
LWFDQEAVRSGLPIQDIDGYERFVHTHTEAARAVAEGRADIAIGLEAAARQENLDFIPLFV